MSKRSAKGNDSARTPEACDRSDKVKKLIDVGANSRLDGIDEQVIAWMSILPNTSHFVFDEKPELISNIAIDFFNSK